MTWYDSQVICITDFLSIGRVWLVTKPTFINKKLVCDCSTIYFFCWKDHLDVWLEKIKYQGKEEITKPTLIH